LVSLLALWVAVEVVLEVRTRPGAEVVLEVRTRPGAEVVLDVRTRPTVDDDGCGDGSVFTVVGAVDCDTT
jgi:hypothetical protein